MPPPASAFLRRRTLGLSALGAAALLLAGCSAPPPPVFAPAPIVVAPTGPVTDSLGIRFVRVPAGEFLMGSDESPQTLARAFPHADPRRLGDQTDEAPVHRVRITRDFWLGEHAVTVGQFRRFVEASGYVPESIRDGTGGYGFNPNYDPALTERGDLFEGRDPRYSWRHTGFAQTDNHPVVNVTWNDAVAMARWLSQREGVSYRLPTEAEWEYAARAGTRTRYPAGDDPAVLQGSANIFDRETALRWPRWREQAGSGSDGHPFTAPAGSFAPNAFGLYDMIGNVWEWCADWYGEDYYARSPVDDPPGPASGEVRVRRGGSWHSWPLYSRVAFRNWNTPETRYVLVGFRLLREAGAAGPR
ncbi:formylglycine-generating enzyme family protein [Ottowia sp.]|uniref:formylglycine-generating enzyme family protein n=1 Tax=Ottowia sp. TaxID=1898956 RepID=UPI002BF08813|nr:formylglycine-generating enzyme family protein [Ottowia sp.]HRN75084.1 formylglycine-generating enzyme family protein [Ottowia sp.]HRQ03379.1 formylglycine-generating enzyme family protein [Ottowia sp.]